VRSAPFSGGRAKGSLKKERVFTQVWFISNTRTIMVKQATSSGTNSQGSSYTNYSDGGYRYSNTNGSSYYSPSGSGAGFYNGGSSGNPTFYGRADGSRNYL
jgi:hypothetical protein